MTRPGAILIKTHREGRWANKQEKRGRDGACEGVWANTYGSACVSTCVGEPYAAKWQPRGGERLIKIEWELVREGKMEKQKMHERNRGRQWERQSACEHVSDSFETRSSVAEPSERCVSRGVDETWHTLAIAHSSLHQSCSAAESVPLSPFLQSGIDCVGSMLAISIFSCGKEETKQ